MEILGCQIWKLLSSERVTLPVNLGNPREMTILEFTRMTLTLLASEGVGVGGARIEC
jgi:hypothetical protein